MNMLIIGNGFDLAHGRPTRYEDFLRFAEYIMQTKDPQKDKIQFQKELTGVYYPEVNKTYILQAFDDRVVSQVSGQVRNNNETIQEMYNCLDKNVWYEYFRWIRTNDLARGKNWVDFEGEIRTIVEFFDRHPSDLYEYLPTPKPIPSEAFHDGTRKVSLFWELLDFSNYNVQNQRDKSYKNTYFDLIEKTYQDLENLIRCLEIYLDDCVEEMSVPQYFPDIEQLKIDYVLSFNYTKIPEIYPSFKNVHHIHGYAKARRSAKENNMVLGINEYWDDVEKDSRTNFNCYKKFVQRIIKETGINYKNELQKMRAEYSRAKYLSTKTEGYTEPRYNNVYILGHSLDVTDGDILREVIQTPGVVTTVFYKNKQQQANQIANLSKVLGQDKLLEYVFTTSPTIIFKEQPSMRIRYKL